MVWIKKLAEWVGAFLTQWAGQPVSDTQTAIRVGGF
jgi:hypothetical protein